MTAFESYQNGLLGAEAYGRGVTVTPIELLREDFQVKAIRLVVDYVESHLEKTDSKPQYTAYVVWFSKTLQNWKALVSTSLPDGMYYEVTYNGDKHETYIDAYKKFDNVCVAD